MEKIKAQETLNQKNQPNENAENNLNQPKLFQYIPDQNNQNNQNSNPEIAEQSPENKNAPIVLQPIENQGGEVAENAPPKENSLLDKFTKTPQKFLDEANKLLQIDNQQQNNENKNNDMNIPPVYVKQQNGENDFKNGDVVNNVNTTDAFPQFVN